ncbi:transcription factor nrm1 whi5 [Stemphylium lycopersici]|uniref:Transcription factor nrm1 whi5 n=1 Tax=Stemphylium lycopersici TaxID=183478 RepID=A0A364N5F4_STELY|nr:transcription factor nrm1 whi5 [Stemphylium lycopersici]RAR12129.1 transcription factor nrm1 whi5 [Stemphylium lycopersici]
MAEQDEVASKVLRRAQVSKMTRTLQNRLALANVKMKNGWESLSLDAIEPVLDGAERKRKRPGSSNEAMSDVSSVSERFYQPSILDSSPLQAPIFSDDLRRSESRSGSSYGQTKRPRYDRINKYPASSNHARVKVRTSTGAATSWKNNFQLPESSPVYHRRHARFGRHHVPSLSFVSETSTIADPHSPLLSEDDDEDLPITSFSLNRSHFQSSPPRAPRTPPPDVARSARLRQRGFNAAGAAREGKQGDDDANLLMYLATSPTPVRPGHQKPQMLAPSTPPSKATPLPSSMMSTPGGGGSHYTGFGLATPSTNLNFAEFLNMTPSPAQAHGSWNRTPIATRTPAAVREARRHLNFDNIVPPTGDGPHMGVHVGKVDSLGMELGGELIS